MKNFRITLLALLMLSTYTLQALENKPSFPGSTEEEECLIVTDDKQNSELLNTLPAVNILNLSGQDANGKAIKRFRIESLPSQSAGTLYLEDGKTEVIAGQVLSINESDNLRFDPNEYFEGNGIFTYASVDTDDSVDTSPATFTLPVISAIVAGENNDADCPTHEENCTCEPYEKSIPTFSKFGILFVIMLTILFGKFFIKKEI